MNSKRIMKKIYKTIKKYDTIVIARHIGPDPDSISSQVALRDVILNTFPNKKVYAVGAPVSKFRYLGTLDKQHDDMYENSLLIVVDLPDKGRVDGVDISKFEEIIKIDHHPFIDDFGGIEWVDDTASSAAQMVSELILNTKLVLTKEAAEKLFIGIVADTNRFMFYYTTPKTFKIVSKLIETTHMEFTTLYENLYLKPMNEIKFQGYVASHMTITENGFAYIIVDEEKIKEFDVDLTTARNTVNDFNFIDKVFSWAVFTYDHVHDMYRGSLRSRGPVINKIAEEFNGGGHKLACGVRNLSDFDIESIVDKIDDACHEYTNKDDEE